MKTLALKVDSEQDGRYAHIRAKFCWIDTESQQSNPKYNCQLGEIVWPDCWGETKWAHNLRINSQTNIEDDGKWTHYYGMELHYDNCSSLEISDLEVMLKTLRKIVTAHERYITEHGRYTSIAEFCFQIAKVSKCKYLIVKSPENREYGYRALLVDDTGLGYLRRLERDSIAPLATSE